MLMHDLLNPASPKNPANRAKYQLDNSLELFRTQARLRLRVRLRLRLRVRLRLRLSVRVRVRVRVTHRGVVAAEDVPAHVGLLPAVRERLG